MKVKRICIIGSGPVGSLLAKDLSEDSSKEIIIIEAGEEIPMQNHRVWLDYLTANSDPFEKGKLKKTDFENTGNTKYAMDRKQLYALGGSGIVWHGISQRLKPEDFKLQTNTGHGFDWPFDYDVLEPYYQEAEQTLQVSGDINDKDHPPRTSPFPMQAFPFELDDRPFLETMEKFNYSTQHQCLAINSQSSSEKPACETIGTCNYCPIGARFTTDQIIRRFNKRSNIKILTQTIAQKFHFSSKEKISSLEVYNKTSNTTSQINADLFLICTGGIETPKLLLRSKNDWWPTGVSNHNDFVGKYFMTHPIVVAEGVRKSNPFKMAKELSFSTAVSRHFDSEDMQKIGKFYLQNWASGYELEKMMELGISKEEIDNLILKEHRCSLSAILEEFPDKKNQISNKEQLDRYGIPKTLIDYSWNEKTLAAVENAKKHLIEIMQDMGCEDLKFFNVAAAHPMGTCMMSKNADVGVVDQNLKLRGVDNAFACGTAVFPSGGSVNPTLTIIALTHRLRDYLATYIQ